jgi:multiple sugar transport system permease protein
LGIAVGERIGEALTVAAARAIARPVLDQPGTAVMSQLTDTRGRGAGPVSAAAQRANWRYRLRKAATAKPLIAFLLALPLIGLIGGLIVYPFFDSIRLSMMNKAETQFVGVHNFALLFQRETFWQVTRQTFVFALTAVFFKSLIGFTLAHLINAVPEGRQRIWRGLLLVPWVMPPALSTLAWLWMFDPSYSVVNWMLQALFGVSRPWLSSPNWARASTIIVNVWWGSGFFMIMYLAGLKSVPVDLYEAAEMDGANWWQQMRYVTIPMMMNVISVTMLFSIIVTFAHFDIVRVLTNGGPRSSTELFGTYAFKLGIDGGELNLAAAVAMFMFPILAVLAFFILRSVTRRAIEQ